MPRIGLADADWLFVLSVQTPAQIGERPRRFVTRLVVQRSELDHAHAALATVLADDEAVVGAIDRVIHAAFDATAGPVALGGRVAAGGVGARLPGHEVSEQRRRRQLLDLLPGRSNVRRLHPTPGICHEYDRLVAELVHQSRHAVGDAVDGVTASRLEALVPVEPCSLRLRPQIGNGLRMVERFEIGTDGDPLRKALHLRRGQPLFEGRRAGQHDVDGRQRRRRVRQQSQFFDETQRESMGLVHQDHEPRSRGGQVAHHLRHGDPQLGYVDATVGLSQVDEDRLPERPTGADPCTGEQGHPEVLGHTLAHLRQEQRLTRTRRPDHQRDSLGAADRAVDGVQRPVDQPCRVIELRARDSHEGAGGRVSTGLMHGFEYPEVAVTTSDPFDFDQRPRLPATSDSPVDFDAWRKRLVPDRWHRI